MSHTLGARYVDPNTFSGSHGNLLLLMASGGDGLCGLLVAGVA